MRRNKTFAGILLFFSIANVVLAAPASMRQRRLVTDRTVDEQTGESNQDPAGSVHQEVVPAVTPPPVETVESLAGSEKLPSLSKMSSSNEDSVPNSLYGPSAPHQNLVPVSGAPQLHDDLPIVSGGPRLQYGLFPWWLHTDWRPFGTYEVGEPSHTASQAQMMRPASGAQPLHDDTISLHDLNPITDMDQVSTKTLVADETHIHL
jgi:hypothetical protein